MIEGTPACARPSKKYPNGRTGTLAGATAHRRLREPICPAYSEVESARARSSAAKRLKEDVPPGVLICALPTAKYPAGRTGTAAGYVAHMQRADQPCDPCRGAHTAAQQARYLSDRERFNQQHRIWRYGITDARYDELLAAQDGRCAVCHTETPRGRGRFHIDHDHECCPGIKSCGRCVRGLLCNACNTGLGLFRDNPDRLIAAAAYLLSARGGSA